MGDRFLSNPFPDYQPNSSSSDILLNESEEFIKKNLKKLISFWEKGIRNDPNDFSVYTGTSGIVLLYLRLSQTDFLEKSDKFLKISLRMIEDCMNNLSGRRYGFMCGQVGVFATAALVYYSLEKTQHVQKYLKHIRDIAQVMLDDSQEVPDEILYGRSGYLYALLLLRSQIEASKSILDDDLIRQIIRKILSSGQLIAEKEKSKIPLVYYWHNKGYVGAAHGYAGILYMLLEAHQYLTEEELNNLIQPTIEFVYSLRFGNTQNYPSSLSNPDDKLVQWCHGSPGVIHLLLKSYQLFNDQKYLDAAIQASDDIWNRGILKKGTGLCHGTAGNAYAFIRIYQTTNDPKYLYRSIKFAQWCCENWENYANEKRSDSLFEGLAGTIYFLVDILQPHNSKFPAFQLDYHI